MTAGPDRPDRPRQRHLELHRWLGAGATVLLFALSLTGTLTVLMPELLRWERSAAWTADATRPPGIAAAVQAAGVLEARAQTPEPDRTFDHLSITPAGEQPWVEIFARGPGGRRSVRVFTDRHTGELSADTGRARLTPLRHLHTRLLAPRPFAQAGRIMVGIAGLVMLSLVGSGLVMHGGLRALIKRPAGRPGSRARWIGLHRWAGLLALPFSATIAATGAFLGLTTLLLVAGAVVEFGGDGERTREALSEALGSAPELESSGETGPGLAAVDAQIASLLAAGPAGLELRSVEIDHPHEADAAITVVRQDASYSVLRNRRLDTLRLGDLEPRATTRVTALSPAAQTLLATSVLHFGDAWGRVSRLVYAMFGALLSVSMLWGIEVWRARAPDAAAPRTSMLICRSLVIAVSCFAAICLVLERDALAASQGEALLVASWGLAAMLLWALTRRPQGADTAARVAVALSLGILVVSDLLRAPIAGRPAMVWSISAALLLATAAAAWLARRSWKGVRQPGTVPPPAPAP